MRRFFPYFKYLRKVRTAVIAGVFCGVLYGAAGGLGLPLMIKYVIPRVLLADPTPPPKASVAKKPGGFDLKRYFDLDRWFDRWLPAPPASAPAPKSPAPAALVPARPALSPWQVWVIALWVPAIFIVRGVAGYLNAYLIQYAAGVHILEQESAWTILEPDFAARLLPAAFDRRADRAGFE